MGVYKPHPVWKSNDMQECPVCSAYVPKSLLEFHRCPAGSGVRKSLTTIDLGQMSAFKACPKPYVYPRPGVAISDEPPAPRPLSPWARRWKVLWMRVRRWFR